MKTAKALLRAFAIALICVILTGTAALAASGSYYCNGNRVNVRSGPSSAYSSQYKLMKGDVVTYVSQSNGWYKVTYYNKRKNTSEKGYVYRKYLTSVSSGSSSSSGSTYKTTANLRVRSQASTQKGYVKTKLKKGTKVKVLKQKGSWVYISYSKGNGWVSAKYLKKAK